MDGRESTDCPTAGQGWVAAIVWVAAIAMSDTGAKSGFRISRTSGVAVLGQVTNRLTVRWLRPILVQVGSFTCCGISC